jgi:hypothetical protein
MKTIQLFSLLPQWALTRLARLHDDPGAFELPELGNALFMNASYWKYVRIEKRKRK